MHVLALCWVYEFMNLFAGFCYVLYGCVCVCVCVCMCVCMCVVVVIVVVVEGPTILIFIRKNHLFSPSRVT